MKVSIRRKTDQARIGSYGRRKIRRNPLSMANIVAIATNGNPFLSP
jgi:hypothetical protein